MKVVKRILKFLALILIGLLIAAIFLPYIYKDKLVANLKSMINNEIHATVDFSDIDLSIFRAFPDINVAINDLTVDGAGRYLDTRLLSAEDLSVSVSLASLINEDIPYQINSLHIDGADLHIVREADGSANYLITKEKVEDSASSAPYTIALDQYEISNSNLRLIDKSSGLDLQMKGIDHKGKGNITESIYDLDTRTTAKELTARMDGAPVLLNVDAALDAMIHMDNSQEKYTLKENKLRLNTLEMQGDGFVQFMGEDMRVKADLKGLNNKFKNYLSVVPGAYKEKLKGVATNGTGALSIVVDGKYNGDKAIYPGLDLDLNIKDGYVLYRDGAEAVEGIQSVIRIDAKEGNYSDMRINIPTLKARVGNDFIDGQMLIVQDTPTDQKVSGKLHADIDLRNWIAAIPEGTIEQMDGKVKSNIEFAGNTRDIKNENYTALQLKGDAKAANINIQLDDKNSLKMNTAQLSASPQKLEAEAIDIQYGDNDINKVSAAVDNPLSLMIEENEGVVAQLHIDAKTINMDSWQEESNPKDGNSTAVATEPSINLYKSKVDAQISADRLIYEGETWSDITLSGKYADDKLIVQKAEAHNDKNDISMDGKFSNVWDYIIGESPLKGSANISSKYLDLNDFMQESPATESSEKMLLVPEMMDIVVKGSIDQLKYTDKTLKDSKFSLAVKDEAASINQLSTHTFGGQVNFQGTYSSKDKSTPAFDMKLDMSQIKFLEAFNQIQTVKALAPIMQYLDGVFNTTLVLNGTLDKEMNPVYSQLNASGYIETINAALKDTKILGEIGDKLNIQGLKKVVLDNTKNWFDIVNGTVELKPKEFTVEDIDMRLAGRHGFGTDMNYVLAMKVPREKLNQSKLTSELNKGIEHVLNLAKKQGLDLGAQDIIDVEVGIKGRLKNPKLTYKIVGFEKGEVKSVIEDKIEEETQAIKDSVKTIIKNKEQEIRDTVDTITKEVVDSTKKIIKKKTDIVKDTIQAEINKQIDSLANQIGVDSIGDSVKDILNGKADEEVDKIKDKIKDWNPFKKKKNN